MSNTTGPGNSVMINKLESIDEHTSTEHVLEFSYNATNESTTALGNNFINRESNILPTKYSNEVSCKVVLVGEAGILKYKLN